MGCVRPRVCFSTGSNPGYDVNDDCPTGGTTDDFIVDYYETGFPDVFPRNVGRNGRPNPKAVPFWSGMRGRAAELYGRAGASLRPGIDFALTEVVHCKSKRERVARTATDKCIGRHFASIATLSLARVVVVFGSLAANSLEVPTRPIVSRQDWYGRERLVLWLPHPNAHTDRTVCGSYSTSDISALREALA